MEKMSRCSRWYVLSLSSWGLLNRMTVEEQTVNLSASVSPSSGIPWYVAKFHPLVRPSVHWVYFRPTGCTNKQTCS